MVLKSYLALPYNQSNKKKMLHFKKKIQQAEDGNQTHFFLRGGGVGGRVGPTPEAKRGIVFHTSFAAISIINFRKIYCY